MPAQFLAEVTVAVAYDDAFNCYFPDTLDLLELQGATVKVFSPLTDAELPEGTEVVYLGCGHPERCAEALAANRCLVSALCDHVLQGGRVYAEGGGLAYLCEEIATPKGQRWPMVGVLPAVAHLVRPRRRPLRLKSRSPRRIGSARGGRNFAAISMATGDWSRPPQ